MKILCLFLLGITAFVELLVPTLANTDGFISINCGASEDDTGGDYLQWLSDSPYTNVSSRKSSILPNGDPYLPYRSISYFKDLSHKKYCYLLPVKPDMKYLVRTGFNFGRFNSQSLPLANEFDLLIEGVKWTRVYLPNNTLVSYEIILATKNDQLSLCLARSSLTEPRSYVFITTIELRPLDSSMYGKTDFNESVLVKINRKNFGGEHIRYRENKFDEYDRIWYSYKPKEDMDPLSSNNYVGKDLPNHVPQKVLQTAVSAKEIGDMNISDDFFPLSLGSYYFIFYFCNINSTATSGNTNTFKVLINKKESDWLQFEELLICRYLDQKLILTTNDIGRTEYSRIQLVLRPFNNSYSKPFINGAELYKIKAVQNTKLEDLLAIREIANAINVPEDWSGADPCLPSNYSSSGITCSRENTPRVIIVNLTNMGLVGHIPLSIAKLTALTQLLLGNNRLSGPIPDLSPLKNLTTLQLQNNQLVGSIPISLEKLSLLKQVYLQNNNLTGSVPKGLVKLGSDLRVDPQIKFPAEKKRSWPMRIAVGCSVLWFFVVICTAFICRHRRRSQPFTKNSPISKARHVSEDVEDQCEYRKLAIEYTEEEIKAATKNYSKVIGKGSFGSVFHGKFSGSDVAVKVLSADSNQGKLEFNNELTVLSRIHHRNLVNLVGYCRQPTVALVYEYMECGSLKDHLYGMAKLENPLDWHTRLNIALQAAEGLLYLHHGCNPPIIHRDIKSNNILLDGNMCAKVADFGLSKVVESSKSHVSTIVKGTIGYLDPEYFETSTLTEKSDVYSFGVVLLEILSGKSAKDRIVESGRKLLSCGRIADLIDTSLGGRYNVASAWRVAETAYGCTQPKSINRPKMSVVVKELQEAAALPEEDVNLYGNYSITTSTQGVLPSLR